MPKQTDSVILQTSDIKLYVAICCNQSLRSDKRAAIFSHDKLQKALCSFTFTPFPAMTPAEWGWVVGYNLRWEERQRARQRSAARFSHDKLQFAVGIGLHAAVGGTAARSGESP